VKEHSKVGYRVKNQRLVIVFQAGLGLVGKEKLMATVGVIAWII